MKIMTNKHDFGLPTIREVLNNNNIKINKSLGQNFLFDINLTDKIVKRSLPIRTTVIEVGPGPGCLTRSILKQQPNIVFAIDKDIQSKKMLNDLKKIYNSKLEIIIDDALHYPIWELGTAPRQIIANLPYNIGTKMLISWLKHINQFDMMTLMFQKEVADRIIAKPGSKQYGRLSVLTNWLTNTNKLFDIPNTAFFPPPKVSSSVVQLTPFKKPLYDVKFESVEKITQMAFSQRRKMLKSSLKEINSEKILTDLSISPSLRPEDLSVLDFCRIAKMAFEN